MRLLTGPVPARSFRPLAWARGSRQLVPEPWPDWRRRVEPWHAAQAKGRGRRWQRGPKDFSMGGRACGRPSACGIVGAWEALLREDDGFGAGWFGTRSERIRA